MTLLMMWRRGYYYLLLDVLRLALGTPHNRLPMGHGAFFLMLHDDVDVCVSRALNSSTKHVNWRRRLTNLYDYDIMIFGRSI